jgi:HAD superfamily hydrolase (TIGR01549 family)
MVKAILFDFWGTLVEQGVRSPIKQLKNALQVNLPFSEYVVRMERAMMTESFPTLKDAFTAVFREFNVPLHQEILEQLVGMWNKNWMLAFPYEETESVLKKLQENYSLILISNADNFSVKNVLEKFSLEKYFDKIYLSYQTHLIKTDKNFLKLVLDENHLTPEDCVLVGDSIQSDMMAAKRLEIKGVLVDRRNSRDFDIKIKNLNELEGHL